MLYSSRGPASTKTLLSFWKLAAWLTVKRQAMTADAGAPVGVYFGTTSGEVWASRDEGRTWKCLATHLPEIYSVETM